MHERATAAGGTIEIGPMESRGFRVAAWFPLGDPAPGVPAAADAPALPAVPEGSEPPEAPEAPEVPQVPEVPEIPEAPAADADPNTRTREARQ